MSSCDCMYALLQVRVGVRVGVSKEVLVVGPIKLKGKGHDVVLPVLGALVVKHVLLWNASPGSQAKGAPVRRKFQSAVRLCVAGASACMQSCACGELPFWAQATAHHRAHALPVQ